MVLQNYLPFALVISAMWISHTYSTPVHNHLEANSPLCPSSWFQYGKFCVAAAPIGSERTVALYCDGLGGIGVNGICVIRARSEVNEMDNSGLVSSSEFSPLLSSPEDSPTAEGALGGNGRMMGEDENDDDDEDMEDEGAGVSRCPPGWSHYRLICVYRPWRHDDTCNHWDAVHFRGMCLKHAETRVAKQAHSERSLSNEKRICCCAHVNARANRYGC